MALSVTSVGANPQIPSVEANAFIPDQLIYGNADIITETATLVSGAGSLVRGTVLGKITASGKLKTCLTASNDGSETPYGILVDAVDATSADKLCGVYLAGWFNTNALTLGAGWTAATIKPYLRAVGIYITAAVLNTDPS